MLRTFRCDRSRIEREIERASIPETCILTGDPSLMIDLPGVLVGVWALCALYLANRLARAVERVADALDRQSPCRRSVRKNAARPFLRLGRRTHAVVRIDRSSSYGRQAVWDE